MPPIGETLREARMRRQLDISEVEQRTKIRAKYLRALENEDWGTLPGPTFVKTFLRTYAEVLGVDGHMLVEEFRANHEPEEEPDTQPLAPAPARRRRRRPPPGPPNRAVVAIGVVVMFVGFLLVLGLVGDEEEGGTEDAARETPRQQTAPARPARRPKRPAPPREVSVRIAPSVPTYACVDTGTGSNIVFEGILEQPRTFRHARELRFNLGKRSVTVRANGKDVTFEPSPEPVGLDVTRTGTKEIAAGSRPCA